MAAAPPPDSAPKAWTTSRTFTTAFDDAEILSRKDASISVVLPARNVAATFEPILGTMTNLEGQGWIDELVVVTSPDDPAARSAEAAGVQVLDESEPVAGTGPSEGKGDAIWRALRRVHGDIVVLLDTDTENFGPWFLTRLVAPLLLHPEIAFVKGSFRRPLQIGGVTLEHEGGRVSELVARPLLNLFFPELAGFHQPLAGEVAFRRQLLSDMHIPVGYGLEIAMLLDAWKIAGIDALAQVDLGERRDANQTLKDLVPMAQAVIVAALARVPGAPEPASLELWVPRDEELEDAHVSLGERPPPLGASAGGGSKRKR